MNIDISLPQYFGFQFPGGPWGGNLVMQNFQVVTIAGPGGLPMIGFTTDLGFEAQDESLIAKNPYTIKSYLRPKAAGS
ncbi:MAG TPA: hypothetical protein VF656_10545 [Pyrinomonadaceae bacterium]|jgi:hypothetical protein